MKKAVYTRLLTDPFLNNLPMLWSKLDLAKRQALLQKVFGESILVSSDRKIRTDKLSPSFQLIEAIASSDGEIVTPRGIEPRLPG